MMLPTVPLVSITGPPAPGRVPENRVTKASPGWIASWAIAGVNGSSAMVR